MYGDEAIQKLQSANVWVKSFLPACHAQQTTNTDSSYRLKDFLEKAFSGKIFTKLNSYLLESTVKYWKRKYAGHVNENDFEIAFRSQPGVSKSHPQFFQKKVLDRLSQKVREFEIRHGFDLTI
jgi:hypothetical protein